MSSKYETLENLVMPKSSEYKGYTACFVQIIPKKPGRYNDCFTPSNKEKGTKCPKNELIRVIDGAGFYELATGRREALYELFQALPCIIEEVFREDFDRKISMYDKKAFDAFFHKAYMPH